MSEPIAGLDDARAIEVLRLAGLGPASFEIQRLPPGAGRPAPLSARPGHTDPAVGIRFAMMLRDCAGRRSASTSSTPGRKA